MIRTTLIIVSTLLSPLSIYANESQYSIQQILDLAEKGPEVKSAKASADEAKARSTSVFRQIYIPKLSAGYNYQRLLNDQAIQIPNLLTLPLDHDNRSATIGITQVLFDPASMLYKHPASESLAQASSLNASRQIKETQSKAIELSLQSLELRAKRKALEKYVGNLKNRLNELQRIYELGGLGESDVLKVKLGIADASQGVRDLQKGEDYLADMTAAILGEIKPIVPADLPDELPTPFFNSEEVDVSKREDIQAIGKQIDAIGQSRTGNKAEYLPKVYGYYQHNYTNNGLLTKSNFNVVGVQVSWSLFDGGVNMSDASASALQQQALESKRSLAISAFQADVKTALAGLKIKKQEYEERRKDAIEAKSVSDSEFRRLRSGKSTVNNLIDAEDILKDRSEKASLSKISWYQAWFNLKRASGEALITP
jgi:outer membrane protein TolC